jgi:flavodoxin
VKGIVAYDSVHGSTRTAAEAIAEQLRAEGHEAQLIFVREWGKEPLAGDLLFIGSPTRGGKMTKEALGFIESLDVGYWKGRRVVVFDTLGPMTKDAEKRKQALDSIPADAKNAASRMREVCLSRGLTVAGTMHFAAGMWGPLASDGAERAKELTRKFLSGP